MEQGAQAAVLKSQSVQKGKVSRGKLFKIFHALWKTAKTQEATETVTVRRTEYLFRDYRLVRAAVTGVDDTEQKQTEQILREQLRELTEDPDHTYIVCREPLSFYYGREFREDEERLTWELEDEYGLIPEIRLLPEAADYDRVRLEATAPCLVLDFCDSDKVYGGGLAVGSVWLDFPASEEKERRVTSGCLQIRYFSMKKEWKDPRKA